MKILVAGGSGQLGSEFSHWNSPTLECICLGSSELDITNAAAIKEQLAKHSPDIVINCAAYTAVDKAEEEKARAYAINCDGVTYLAHACASADIPLLHVSTDYVFSGSQTKPYLESDATDPQGVYGASKLAGELALKEAWHKHIILRVSWVFGRYGANFVKTMLRVGRERDELNVVADQLGAPTAARSIAENLINVAERLHASEEMPWGTYHFQSGPFTSWHGFAEEIFAQSVQLNKLPKSPTVNAITSSEYPTPAARPANSQMLSAKKLPGIVPCNWQEELQLVLKVL